MFSFTKKKPDPIEIDIDGTKYSLPRFLAPAMIEFSEQKRKEHTDAATAHMKDEAKAHYLMFFEMPPPDIAALRDWIGCAKGAVAIVRASMRAAGVPEADADEAIASTDTMDLRALATELAKATKAASQINADAGGKGDSPLAEPQA